ncbi:MAG: translation initiation factor IF-2 [Sphingobacteriaceae bacterium]|nr:translation initiation factor IF-2 [Sphingobacteriaceae bacterium]
MSEGSIRIKKAATEFNISVGHVVDHLAAKGFEVDANPNAKITDEMYGVLLRDFGQDKKIKEQAAQISIGVNKKEDVVLDKKAFGPATATPSEPEADEVLIKGMNKAAATEAKPAPKAEEAPVAAKPVAETPAPAAKAAVEAEKTGLKVLGKIDLSTAGKPKAKPAAEAPKAAAPEAAPKAEAPKVAAPAAAPASPQPEAPKAATPAVPEAPAAPAAKAEAAPQVAAPVVPAVEKPKEATAEAKPAAAPEAAAPVAEAKAATPVAAPAAAPKATEKPAAPAATGEDEDVVRAKADKLQGTTVLRTIDLSQFEKRKPVASSSDSSVGRRKRKRKDGPAGAAPATGATPAANVDRPLRSPNAPGTMPQRPQGNRPHGGGGPGGGQGGNRRGPAAPLGPKAEPTEKEIQDQIKATMARLQGGAKGASRAKYRKQRRDDHALRDGADLNEDGKMKLQATEFLTTGELAGLMDVPVGEVIMNCFSLGLVVTINQRLDAETITLVADEFGYDVEFISADANEPMIEEEDDADNMTDRSPIVTIMGHVDHGKTSLLDFIRKENVIAGEAGGITQHIGAYAVQLANGKQITFLDTPGHEAFTAMRARGAKVTDIVVIVIAADDSVMPQTKEAISHAQAANVPLIFAINKVDRPGANPERIREQLSAMNILVESWGGKYQDQEISAKFGQNVDALLEKILLEAEILELKADPKKRAVGTVIEASLDKGRGVITTVLIEGGTLEMGDPILAGANFGKVKALMNERGQRITKVGPSQPVQILGFNSAPTAGDRFYVTESDAVAKDVGTKRMQLLREQGMRTKKHITLDEIGRRLAIGNFKELNLVVKGDVDGSVEALADSLMKLSTDQIQVNVIHKGVGQISESDVMLASASDAIIVGFQVRPLASVRKLAEQEEIDIRTYSIIYDAIDEIKSAMEGMLAPTFEEKVVCNVQIREVFKISKVGTIAGCMVTDGKITRNTKVRVLRDGIVIHTGELESLKRFKDDVKEVLKGYECGLNIANFNDIQEGDIIEGYERIEVKGKL